MTAKRVKVPLGDVCDVRQGRYLAPGDMSDVKADLTPIPVIGANGVLGYTDQVSYHDPVTLVTCRGSNCGMLQRTDGPTWISNNAMACPPKKPHNSRYIHYVLQATNFSEVVTGSAQPQITAGHLNAKLLAITRDPDEQKAIAEVLGRLDDKITLNNRINAELEGIAKLLYDYWFVQFDFPMTAAQATALGKPHLTGHPYRASGGKMIYNETLKREIPEGWKMSSVKDFAPVLTGKEDANHATQSGEFHFFTCGEQNLRCDDFKFEGKAVLVAGNGNFSVKFFDGRFNAYQRTYVLLPHDEAHFALIYFAIFDAIKGLAQGSQGSIIKFLTKGNIEDVALPLPAQSDKEVFWESINTILSNILVNQKQIQELTQLRDWLLPMLMNGQVTVGTNER